MTAVIDSHRLTGPHLLGDRPGAALDVALEDRDTERLVGAWHEHARRLLDAVGWSGEELSARTFPGGASLVISAPIDGLYAATDLNEAAWDAAIAETDGRPFDDSAAERLRETIVRNHNTRLRALRDAARARGVTFLHDDELVSVGSGRGAQVWPLGDLPEVPAVDWAAVHDVPIVLVTGSNGKTTSVRLLAAIVTAAGLVAGVTSTDGVRVAGDTLAGGDYAGPMGARLALRDRRVDVAILETARGGIFRRGLAIERADVALITNIAADHLDDFGVHDLATLAAAKLVAARAVRPEGRVLLNADDPGLGTHALSVSPATWFAIDPAAPLVAAELAAGGDACFVEDGWFMIARGGQPVRVERVDAVPITHAGSAAYNVSNVLGVLGASMILGEHAGGGPITLPVIARALREFGGTPADNPGRGNFFDLGGVRIVVDYAHNPHGLRAIAAMVSALDAQRRLIVIGQAGDRGDDALRELARAAWALEPDQVILKELPGLHRGREAGSVRRVIAEELQALGLAADSIGHVEREIDALTQALAWAKDGDLVIMLTHEDRDAVLGTIERLRQSGWRPGAVVTPA